MIKKEEILKTEKCDRKNSLLIFTIFSVYIDIQGGSEEFQKLCGDFLLFVICQLKRFFV
jgi:hypothetical protein